MENLCLPVDMKTPTESFIFNYRSVFNFPSTAKRFVKLSISSTPN